ncbi:hypothetical protein OG899_02955 [Streptomyces thermoviolaceus]|uniref:hypothetical protein n=1 Tax=Streptomyces thermoviolaceus TaxID=1952 RepID=UPI003866553A|nr:hypothetical protein OG899_02955 [Streptomyces thermoviolaceus]
MPTAVLTYHERAAVQAYVRLLRTVQARLGAPPAADGPPALLPPSVLADAERALRRAGLNGTEAEFFRLVRDWCGEA